MDHGTQRRISAALGVFFLAVTATVVGVLRVSLLESPVIVVQVAFLGVAGVLDILAGVETRVTERFEWYRLSGLGNVALAAALPLGFVDPFRPVPFAVVLVGSVAFAGMGLDMVFFEGRHVYSEPLDGTTSEPGENDAAN